MKNSLKKIFVPIILSASFLAVSCSSPKPNHSKNDKIFKTIPASKKSFIGNYSCDGQMPIELHPNGRGSFRGLPITWVYTNNSILIDFSLNHNLDTKLQKVVTNNNYTYLLSSRKTNEKSECYKHTQAMADDLMLSMAKIQGNR